MQLASTLFGVCVIEVTPQLEALLCLPPFSLSKEVDLVEGECKGNRKEKKKKKKKKKKKLIESLFFRNSRSFFDLPDPKVFFFTFPSFQKKNFISFLFSKIFILYGSDLLSFSGNPNETTQSFFFFSFSFLFLYFFFLTPIFQ